MTLTAGDLGEFWVRGLRQDLESKRRRCADSLASLKNRESAYARSHEQYLAALDTLLAAIPAPIVVHDPTETGT